MSADAAERRSRVLELRIRLERAAVAAYSAVCSPPGQVRQTEIRLKSLFLTALVEPARRVETHRLARLAGYVYARTSDVLHGRATAPDVPDVVVDEWSDVVDAVLALVSDSDAAGPGGIARCNSGS